MKYGQNTLEVEALIKDIKKITPERYKKYADATYAATYACLLYTSPSPRD